MKISFSNNHFITLSFMYQLENTAESDGPVEYTDGISAEG